jgi:hypothetical protein
MLLTLVFAMIAEAVPTSVLWNRSFPVKENNFFQGKVASGNNFLSEYIPGSSF